MAKSRDEITNKFREEMQGVYGRMLDFCGIEFGDIEPLQLLELEKDEDNLNTTVRRWLRSGMEVENE